VGILHSEGHPIQHQTKEVQMLLEEAIKKASWLEISSPVGTIGRMLRKEEFVFKVSKAETRVQLRYFLKHEMGKMEHNPDVRVVAIPYGPEDKGNFFLRITFG